jgi:hypothetical protein
VGLTCLFTRILQWWPACCLQVLPAPHTSLCSPRPRVLNPPLPQIVADDVKCTHGCTVSDLEEEELFYLRWGRCACCASCACCVLRMLWLVAWLGI